MDKILRGAIRKILRFVSLELSDEQITGILQFIKFVIVGISNTAISYVINVFMLLIMRPFEKDWDFILGNMVAFVLSVFWAFYWSNRFVFTVQDGKQRVWWQTLLKAYLAYGFTGIVLSNLLTWLWINVLEISKYIAPLINLIISVPLNFIINKFWAFKQK